MTSIRLRSGRGLGDSLYLRPIVDYLIAEGNRVTVHSDCPDVFIGSGARVERFTRAGIFRVAHYTHEMSDQSLTQFASMLKSAHVPRNLELRFPWSVRNEGFIDTLRERAAGRPLIMVHGGRRPMQRDDGYGIELMPKGDVFACVLDTLDDCFRVRVGNAEHLYSLPVDADLNGGTTVSDLLDLASVCDGVVAQCSFAVPLAEVFDRPLLAIWSAAGLASKVDYLRTITPKKVLVKPTSHFVIDDLPPERIQRAARGFR